MSQMTHKLKGVVLDGPCQVGSSVYHEGVPVIDVILKAQADYQFNQRRNRSEQKIQPIERKPREPRWHDEILSEVSDYHIRTGKKVSLNDLYEAFMVTGFRDVEPDDRELFIKRVRERLICPPECKCKDCIK